MTTCVRLGAVACVVLASRLATASEPLRPPLPESLLTESATDVDAEEGGELEYEANLTTVAARTGGARAALTSVEVEWRALDNLGIRLEPSYSVATEPATSGVAGTFGFGGALAVGLFHDFARDLHVQAEALGRTPESGSPIAFEPGEPELPFAADLLAAIRRERWTLRATVGVEAGGAFAHAPLHTDLALLTGILPGERFGFVGLEARADWARSAPLVVAPEIVADTTPIGLPFRLGVALPVNVGADPSSPSFGLFVRLVVLTSREVEYGRTGG
jgi:hypothetical protein